jgi:DinB superfamily
MQPSKVLSRFNAVLDTWEQTLNDYSETDFLKKPADDAWSIGQVYNHLIGATNRFHLKQVEICLENTDNTNQSKKMPGRVTYFLGSIPPIKVKVPPSPEYTPPQPKDMATVKTNLQALRPKMAEMAAVLSEKQGKTGKTAHPAFGFLDAFEWFQMVEIHFRHHLRQKERLDKFLKSA